MSKKVKSPPAKGTQTDTPVPKDDSSSKAPVSLKEQISLKDASPIKESAPSQIPVKAPYRVLARKYRPKDFDDLIGQQVMVRTLQNAIRSDRIAQAFMLSGIRGTGKTTTARIIAKALNCLGNDSTALHKPAVNPCNQCSNCIAISEDRHIDVVELDAASRTGVNDIRELTEGVHYRPVNGRYRVYILDEVHMLSINAFNALLKTLEEPPEHAKFIFATTEIRKVPLTVLSRCQRFDLARVSTDELVRHFIDVAQQEGAQLHSNAAAMMARAADGSVRDGLSLLDRAISLTLDETGDKAQTTIEPEQIQNMLGLGDRHLLYDLFEQIAQGKKDALDILHRLYDHGAEPTSIMKDLLEICWWITRLKLTPSAANMAGVSENDQKRGLTLAAALDMSSLSRIWQMLLKGLEDIKTAPVALHATEMALIRVIYASHLPPVHEIIKKLEAGQFEQQVPHYQPQTIREDEAHDHAQDDELVQKVGEYFPGAAVDELRPHVSNVPSGSNINNEG